LLLAGVISAGIADTLLAADNPRSSDNSSLDEVVVPARRVEQRVQDVSISISVFNERQIEYHNIVGAEDSPTDAIVVGGFKIRFGPHELRDSRIQPGDGHGAFRG
jgi:hypothetical protein